MREFDALVALSATQPALVRPGEAIWHADCIEAWIRSGRVDAARALLDSFAAVAATSGLNWASASAAPCRGLLAADDAFEQHFAEAFAYHEHDRWPFERARTALCLGERGRRARRPRDARSPLHEALAAFEQLGAPQWAERARAEVRRTGERVSRREGGKAKLTSRELEVARLVGDELATTPSASLK